MVDPPILSARNLTKRFGEFTAVDNVTLEVSRGRSLCIIGPNGAGKTTFINLVSGFFYPDEGFVMFEGADITHLSPAKRVKAGLARTFQLVHVFDNLTVADNLGLSFFRKKENSAFPLRMFCSSLTSPSISQRVADSLEIFGLHHQKDEITRNLPLGAKSALKLRWP